MNNIMLSECPPVKSAFVTSEPRGQVKDAYESSRGVSKSRIPQRLGKSKLGASNNVRSRGPGPHIPEAAKQKFEVAPTQQPRFSNKNAVRSKIEEGRPKSANRVREEYYTAKSLYTSVRAFRLTEKTPYVQRKPLNISNKRLPFDNHNHLPTTKSGKPYITVSLTQKLIDDMSMHNVNDMSELPDQESVDIEEGMKLMCTRSGEIIESFYDEDESNPSHQDLIMQLKDEWQEKMVEFEKMKHELGVKQKAILELYSVLRNIHTKMLTLGKNTIQLPMSEDLRIMNVCKMTPEQILHTFGDRPDTYSSKTAITIDVDKFYDLPAKLVDTCEQTLSKRKEIIDWFESLKSQERKISMNKLSKKINEFNAENDMLKCSLEQVKSDFRKELEDILQYMRRSANDSMALQLRTEELTYELSELNSQNADLRKQIHNTEHIRSQSNRNRLEEMDKELKEERCKRQVLKNQLTRTEGQVKINIERAQQLEAALEQSRTQTWTLERTVQQLSDQNAKLQNDFDTELSKLTDSIKEHTVHLEEIAEARKTLQLEKEELERKLNQLSESYNESLNNVKQELKTNVTKLIEMEKKHEEDIETKKKLETQVETLCAQLMESELRSKDIQKQLKEKELLIGNTKNIEIELERTKTELEKANSKIDENNNVLNKQRDTIQDLEKNIKELNTSEHSLKNELTTKNNYIQELEKKQSLLEKHLQETENKMVEYVEQFSTLKNSVSQLKKHFGEFDSIDDLHDMINKQRTQFLEVTRQNDELSKALQTKDEEILRYSNSLIEHQQQIEQRDGVIKMLTEKEEEEANVIKMLRDNLELCSQAEADLHQQIMEKNTEIDTLIANVETRKKQISNLEKIILTLEDQTRKVILQKKRDFDKITTLEKKIQEYESYHVEYKRAIDTPTENLDSLIKIIENELGTPLETPITKDHNLSSSKKKRTGERLRDVDSHDVVNNTRIYHSPNHPIPTKIVMGNFVKKTYIPSTANDEQFQGDSLDRKKAITSIDTHKPKSTNRDLNTHSSANSEISNGRASIPNILPKEGRFRNLRVFPSNMLRDDKKYKMFKLAGHRL